MNFLVDFKDASTEQQIADYFTANNCSVVKEFAHYEKVYLISCDQSPAITDIIESVVDDSSHPIKLLTTVTFAAPDKVETFSVNDPNNWWKVASLASPDFDGDDEVHAVRGSGITVYMLDSGIQADHPEFTEANVALVHSFNSDFTDTTGHGTALSSVVVGKTCGLTAARLGVVKIFDATTPTLQSDLIAAFDAVLADFVANGSKASVMNMSWAIAKNEYIESKITKLIDAGIWAVSAAGNDGSAIADVTPASMSNVITIGSYNEDLEPSDFSNYTNTSTVSMTAGPVNSGKLSGWAPGENIYTALAGGTYTNIAGTSVSSAIHAGALAYNLSSFITDAGQVPPCYQNSPNIMSTVSGTALDRKGLLHITDPKYVGSRNAMTTYRTHVADVPVNSGTEFRIKAGQQVCLRMFSNVTVSSVTFDAPLPTGVTMENGILMGSFETVAGDYEKLEISMTLTLASGGTVPHLVKIWVMAAAYDVAADPNADPVLKIQPEICDTCCNNTTCAYMGCAGQCENRNGPKDPVNCCCTYLDC